MRDKAVSFLQREIDRQTTPGAVIRVKHKGRILLNEALGTNSLGKDKTELTTRHVFDMASLTKVMVTLPLVLQLLESGDIYLHDRVTTFFPEFAAHGKENIRIQQLLSHSSGLPSHRHYFEQKRTVQEIYSAICGEQLAYAPGTKVEYSDLGFILLMGIVEKATGKSIEECAQQHLFGPMGMNNTKYRPDYKRSQYAPTEWSERLQDHKYGIVHDENTESMGGVSGHAGLFSTLGDTAIFTDMLENDGMHAGRRILHPLWLKKSRENFTPFSDECRGLGWQLKDEGPGPMGDLMSPLSYGHTGFTGTSFYIDPVCETSVILLTNRVYFGRQDAIIRLRPRLHNIILANLPEE
ncbi:serine hydrolase [Planomicrobium sp. CPCC 101110]|uniref:serine hydrolase domain-containing protein n=1 Tax=Planomicrobium sp. CPCC 101110 TaxID=2599619 RepID=UPI0011B5A4B9|nr:serine hydrolase domain-containing protein [Planomicrobium sp. CPCC 101110]TWT25375.1 beta-lactamase family protein [Planomicrobium sp. CPCC 101110]